MRPRPFRSGLAVLGLLAAVCFAALPARAQETSDGSLYSRFGIGALESFGSSQVDGMGGAGLALHSLNYVNFDNPASWSQQVLTRAAAGVAYQGVTITDAQDNTSRLTAGALNAIQFSFPLLTRRLGVAIGFTPYSRTSYRVEEEGFVRSDPLAADSTRFLIDHEGRGGLQQFVGGLGYRILPDLSVGANVRVLFGILEDARQTTFPDDRAFAETDLVTATRLAGVSGRFGVLYSPSGILGERDELSVAATFTLPATLRGSRVRTIGESLDLDTLGTRVRGSVKLPLGAALGLAYRPDDRWTFAVDGLYEPWSDFSSTFDFPGYAPGTTSGFTDRIRAAAGFEFLPAGNNLLEPYVERVSYRLGVTYDRLYVSPVPSVDLQTMSVTGGLGLPTLLPGTHLDLNLEVGTRGTTDHGLVHDVFYRFTATVNIGERWFQKQKLR